MEHEHYKETFETWNKVASLYEEKFMDLDLYNETYDFICDSLPTQASLLEIGCGPGNITKYLLNKRPDFEIYGIDTAPNMITIARRHNPTASFDVMDSREIHKLETKFDAIICGFILPYLSPADCEKVISDASLLLQGNGLIYLSFVEGNPNKSGFQVGSTGDRSYFYYYELDQLKAILIDNHFEEIKLFKIEYPKSEEEKDIHTVFIGTKN